MTFRFMVALGVFWVGVLIFGIAGGRFRFRALANKRPWDGGVREQAIVGGLITVIGVLLIWAAYPYK